MIEIPLTQNQIALIDDEDLDLVKNYKWCAWKHKQTYYSHAATKNGKISLHRLIIGAKTGQLVDHINGNGLDNRKSNLRIVDSFGNARNRRPRVLTSQYKGVCWHKRRNKWQASIYCDKQNIHLGTFSNEIEAAKAYDQAAVKYFGEFAYLNFEKE
jgi:hypothetical protein